MDSTRSRDMRHHAAASDRWVNAKFRLTVRWFHLAIKDAGASRPSLALRLRSAYQARSCRSLLLPAFGAVGPARGVDVRRRPTRLQRDCRPASRGSLSDIVFD